MRLRSEKAGPTFEIEAGLFHDGGMVIAGADEAGRGSLAGPLSVGLVIFDSSMFSLPVPHELLSVQDSKRLTPARRAQALPVVERFARVALCEHVEADIVDRLNPNRATKYALDALLERSPVKPDILLMDGTFKFDFSCGYRAVKKGDALSMSIAAASIVAKVTRDCLMDSLDPLYPDYCFSVHKGYGTALHLEKIRAHGPSPIHRRSYEPVKSMVGSPGN